MQLYKNIELPKDRGEAIKAIHQYIPLKLRKIKGYKLVIAIINKDNYDIILDDTITGILDHCIIRNNTIEWYCEHNIGHTLYSPDGIYIHGCDGCCSKIDKYINELKTDIQKDKGD